jgi:HK97 family phage prohead protease
MATAQQQESTPKWDGIVRRQVDFTVKAFNAEERWFDVVASTDTIDGHGDIVEQTFDLKRYKKNPIVLWMHNSFGFLDGSRAEDFLPIGRSKNVKVADGQLEARIYLATEDANPIAEKIFKLWQQEILRAVSIGFRPGKVTREENTDTGKVTYRLANNELFEISVVPIPSNPDAVAKSLHEQEQAFFKTIAASAAEQPKETPPMSMTPEEQKALTDAQAAKTVAETALTSERTKSTQLETALKAEKTTNDKLVKDLAAANDALAKSNGELATTTLDALQGVKFAPSERAELDKLVGDIGIGRVKSLLAARGDIALTQPVKVDGKAIGDKPKTAPESTEKATGEGAADAFLSEVETRASKDDDNIFAA